MLRIVNVDNFIAQNKLVGPISSPQVFFGNKGSFHPQGIFSEEIFGIDGSPERRTAMSWIDLNAYIIESSIYETLIKRIDRAIIPNIIRQEKTFSITNDNQLIEDENGEIRGMESLRRNVHKIEFRKSDDDDSLRNKFIDKLYEYINKDMMFINKLLVISPEYRPVMIGSDGRPSLDELNELYVKIITISNQLKSVSGDLYDILSYKLQTVVMDLYEYVRVKVAKKQGMIRNLMLGKRVDFSGRTVISPNPKLDVGTVGVPMRMVCSIFEPFIINGLLNSRESIGVPDEFHSAVKEFLGKELDPEIF